MKPDHFSPRVLTWWWVFQEHSCTPPLALPLFLPPVKSHAEKSQRMICCQHWIRYVQFQKNSHNDVCRNKKWIDKLYILMLDVISWLQCSPVWYPRGRSFHPTRLWPTPCWSGRSWWNWPGRKLAFFVWLHIDIFVGLADLDGKSFNRKQLSWVLLANETNWQGQRWRK